MRLSPGSAVPPHRLYRLVALALLLTLGIGALFARAVWTLQEEEWAATRRIHASLAQTLEHSLARGIDAYELSLQGVVQGLADPVVMGLPAAVRHRALFDESLRMSGGAGILVLDVHGDVVLDSGQLEPRHANLADRDYFQHFAQGRHTGLYIGPPVLSRLTGKYLLPLAHARYQADGRFAGVVVGGLRLEYFNALFSGVDLGAQSGITLFLADGTVVTRFPYQDAEVGKSIAGSDNLRRIQAERSGSFFSTAVLDGVERFYTFRHIGGYPLILSVAQSKASVTQAWQRGAWVLGGFAALLMLATLVLAALFVRELQRRQRVAQRLQQAEHDVRTILDNLPSLVSYWDASLRNRFANKAASAAFGLTPEGMQGKEASELLGASDYALVEPYVQHALAGEPQVFERTMHNHVTDQVRHNHIVYAPDRPDPQGPVQGIFAQVTDITDRKRMEDALFEEKERMRLTLQSIGDAVVCTDAQGRITYINPVAQRMTGWQAFDAADQHVDDVVPLYRTNGERVEPSPVCQTLQTSAPCGPTRGVVLHRRDGHRYVVEETANPITDRHGQLSGTVMVLHDVTETMALAERMAHLAQYDALTDLPNRVLLQDRARQALALARRDGKTLAVMYIDLDGFKQVNDTLGHDMGDQLLVQFARRLQAAVRQSDTVCRQGGDEFVVLLPGLEGPEQAVVVARKVLAVCQAPFDLQGHEVRVGLSAGMALFPQHGNSFEELARHADMAMYAAKRSGRLQVRCFAGAGQDPALLAQGHNAEPHGV
jgi:diguanylate cyclase (GGDEF)-like protein/PAS domain S-box-containing protein